MKPTNVLEHPAVGVLDLVPGESLSLMQDIDDKTTDSSASLFYFQMGPTAEDSQEYAQLRVLAKYL